MTFDAFMTYTLKNEAKEKCTSEVKQRLWERISAAIGLVNAV